LGSRKERAPQAFAYVVVFAPGLVIISRQFSGNWCCAKSMRAEISLKAETENVAKMRIARYITGCVAHDAREEVSGFNSQHTS
jgi:hypothetical protein